MKSESSSVSSPRITDTEREILEEEERCRSSSDSSMKHRNFNHKSSLNRLFCFLGLSKSEQRENPDTMFKFCKICKIWKEKYKYDLYEMFKLVSSCRIGQFEESTIEQIEAKIIETGILEKWNQFLLESKQNKKRYRSINSSNIDSNRNQTPPQNLVVKSSMKGAVSKTTSATISPTSSIIKQSEARQQHELFQDCSSATNQRPCLEYDIQDQFHYVKRKRRKLDQSINEDTIITLFQHVTL